MEQLPNTVSSDIDMECGPKFKFTSPRKKNTQDVDPTPQNANEVAGFGPNIAAASNEQFVQCTAQEFQSHYLPFIPTTEEIDVCVNALALETNSLFRKGDKPGDIGRFTNFKRRGGFTEDIAFEHLVPITKIIGRQNLGPRTANNYPMKSCPNTRLVSDIAGADHRIDACFTRSEGVKVTGSQMHVAEIVVPMEFKNTGLHSGLIENRRQILTAAHHLMHYDARRAWVYGITIDDDRVSLWYFSRSHCAKSSSFNFLTDPKRLISVLISLQFATQLELGYDKHVTRVSDDGSYVYELPQKGSDKSLYFQTVSSIFEPRLVNVSGRMARVWEVEQVTFDADSNNPKPIENASRMALKDVWLDSTVDTEAEIQCQLFADIEEFARSADWRSDPRLALDDILADNDVGIEDEETTELQEQARQEREDALQLLSRYLEGDKFKELFLTIIHHHVGTPLRKVASWSWDPKGLFTVLNEGAFTPSVACGSTRTSHTTHSTTTNQEHDQAEGNLLKCVRSFTPKHRCFFVHAQVCTCLHNLNTVGEVMDILRQSLIALRLMFLAGWVHRDVSTGNILACASPSGALIGKLGDLEYAKRFPTCQKGSFDFKTGTPNFMAAEIRSGTTFYQSPLPKISKRKLRYFTSKEEDEVSAVVIPPVPLIYNPQHDLESIWWIIVWITTSRVNHPQSFHAALRYFNHGDGAKIQRSLFLQLGSNDLQTSYRPELVNFARNMPGVGQRLRATYIKRGEDNLVQNPEAYAAVHAEFWNLFNHLDSFRDKWGSVAVQPLSNRGVERTRDEVASHPTSDAAQLEIAPRRSTRPNTPKSHVEQESEDGSAPSKRRRKAKY